MGAKGETLVPKLSLGTHLSSKLCFAFPRPYFSQLSTLDSQLRALPATQQTDKSALLFPSRAQTQFGNALACKTLFCFSFRSFPDFGNSDLFRIHSTSLRTSFRTSNFEFFLAMGVRCPPRRISPSADSAFVCFLA